MHTLCAFLKEFSVIDHFFPAENKDFTANKDDSQKVNAEVGIALEEVLEEAPKWKVLRVRDLVFVSQFSFRQLPV